MSATAPEVVIYTRGFCGYCAAARDLLQQKGVDFTEHDATLNASLRQEMFDRSGRRTFPQIFIGDRHVGGYDDLAAMDAAGELDTLLGGAPDEENE